MNPSTPARPVRQLAAVMFADMTGYTAMMQEDEHRAKKLRDRQRSALEKFIPEYQGKIIQYFGDGTLSIFNSGTEAVKAAIELQRELLQEPRVNLRIGIHTGDIVYDHQGVYGDCVNLASRIEALSVPGAVLISDKVYDEIKNKPDIQARSLGQFNLKNVKRAVEVFAIANEGLVSPTQAQLGIRSGREKSIAVLPFVNMSSDPDNEYFSDGMSEEILNVLTRVEGLRVTARSSSFTFKGKNEDARAIGQTLGVGNLLTGSVRKSGKRMRITAQLINTTDGYQVWSEVYDSDEEDIFGIQDEISRKILNRLRENFSEVKSEPIVKQPTDNMQAYTNYLRGKFYWNRSNPEDAKKAIQCFEEAISQDPAFALAYCALAFCYSFMGSSGILPASEAYPKAKDLTLKAIELDPDHPESHLALATIKFFHNWDFAGAEESLNKAYALSLNSAFVNQVHGWYLIAKGEFDSAIEKMQEALQLDPLSLPLMCNLADAYSFAKRFDEAIAQYKKVIELDPNYRRAYEAIGMAYLVNGENEKAIEYLEKYHSLVGHKYKGLSSLGHAYAAVGMKEKAEECLEGIRKREELEPGVVLDMDYAFLFMGMREYDKAFEHLNRSYDQRTGIACLGMIFCIRFPMLNEMKSDPRFDSLTKRMGLA
jgi:TolB-like protein/class 3 adenylate cyclase/Tfp pilus assembly protein PilF